MKNNELHVALVQTGLVWEDPVQNRENLGKKFTLLPQHIDLVVLPEMFISGFTMTPGNINSAESRKTLDWMLLEAKKYNTAIVGSIPFLENGQYFNRLFFVEDGGKVYLYDKRHTFTLAGEDKVYESGNRQLVIDYKGFRINPMICYDLRFPVWARNTQDYDILIYVANWPKLRIVAWDTLLKARAIENMSYCIGVNRCGKDHSGYEYPGHSAVYDSLGELLVFTEEETIVYTTLKKEHIETTRNRFKFLEDRDGFNLRS
ncbi:MAG: nitrilase family protein [Maribacter sp.]|nr:MAG: nitrilase family protein [Maribacter sp.]